jgi:hypothetical protein
MLIIHRKKWLLKIAEIYFGLPSDVQNLSADIVIINQSPIMCSGASPFHTLHLNLLQPVDTLLEAIDKQVRYEIRRSETKDSLTIIVTATPDVDALHSFESFYNHFAESKGLSACRYEYLLMLSKHNGLIISNVCDANGDCLVAHAYIVGGKRARLLHSASVFRDTVDKSERALHGRANRLLHWKDILHFKENGYNIYDFGGIGDLSQNPVLAGINEFKMKFGGTQVTEYNSVRANTILGKMALLVQQHRAHQ